MWYAQSYSRDLLAFVFLLLTLVAAVTSKNTVKAPLLLNRKQTEEWKGWMQVIAAHIQGSASFFMLYFFPISWHALRSGETLNPRDMLS